MSDLHNARLDKKRNDGEQAVTLNAGGQTPTASGGSLDGVVGGKDET